MAMVVRRRYYHYGYRVCCGMYCIFFFFKQKTAYEMRISDWSSDVCSSDLTAATGERTVEIAGDPDHPANRGRLCLKGTHLGETEIGRASCRERVCQYV